MPHKRKYRHAKKVIYLEPPIRASKTVRTRITRVLPPPPPPPPVVELPPPPPPPVILPPPPKPAVDDTIDMIAVEVEPSVKSSKSSKSRSKSRSRSGGAHEREVIIERDRMVSVPFRVQPEYETFRYVEAPRRWSPPALPAPLPPRDVERTRIVVEDRRRQREYY